MRDKDSIILESLYEERRSKKGYETYHETFHSVVDEIGEYLERNDVVSAEFSDKMFTGGISYGETEKWSFEIDSIKGKPTRRALQVQVYRMDSGRYELNMYAQ